MSLVPINKEDVGGPPCSVDKLILFCSILEQNIADSVKCRYIFGNVIFTAENGVHWMWCPVVPPQEVPAQEHPLWWEESQRIVTLIEDFIDIVREELGIEVHKVNMISDGKYFNWYVAS